MAFLTTQNGDVILIKVKTPLRNLLNIVSFSDVVINSTVSRYFKKSFKYSVDGLNWVEWLDLTNDNLTNIQLDHYSILLVEYKYERISPPGDEDSLLFDNISLNINFEEIEVGRVFQNSIFIKLLKNYFDGEALCWCLAVLEKMYFKGQLATYLERSNNENEEDRDFISLFKSICYFFGMIVAFGRKFDDFDNTLLSDRFLIERGLII